MSPETVSSEYEFALRAIAEELGKVHPDGSHPAMRLGVRNARRIARIALGYETCSLCEQDAAKAAGKAFKTAIFFHACGRKDP